MKHEELKEKRGEEFKRLTGVKREVHEAMLDTVTKGIRNFGRPIKLSRADQLLMTLMYWREYRSELHIGQSYGVSEATVSRTIRKVESILIKDKRFQLPGRKALKKSEMKIEGVVVDASEQAIQRPKKG